MKSIRLFESMLFVLVIFLVHSCTLSESDSLNDLSEDDRAGSIIRSVSTRGCELDYSVSEEDLDAYIKFKHLSSKDENFTVKSILPFPDANDPAAYVVNYSDYWEMVSADKRISPVIATGPGMFDPETENVNFMAWVHRIAEEVASLKSNSMLPENSENHILFWKLVSADKTVIGNPCLTRSGPDTLFHPVPGHYELYDVETYTYVSDSIGHLISTKWGQDYPYNMYCPRDYSYPFFGNPLCLTGCVPLAGAQILYYYHFMGDGCSGVYDSAYCNTREYPDTDWTQMYQTNKDIANWYKFNGADSTKMAAVLLANIGKLIRVEYHFDGTYGYVSLLGNCLSNEYGLENYFDLFDGNTSFDCYDYIYDLLGQSYPSILCAQSYTGGQDAVHAFIVDRRKQQYTSNTFYYYFIPDDPDNYSYEDYEEVVYQYSSPVTRYFGMNWGWSGQYDDVWCICNGNWFAGGYNFANRLHMLTFLNDGSYPPGGSDEGQSQVVIQ